jgi:hypothetical protein
MRLRLGSEASNSSTASGKFGGTLGVAVVGSVYEITARHISAATALATVPGARP